MDKLQVGQRIDVVQVVDTHGFDDQHEILNLHLAAIKNYSPLWNYGAFIRRSYGCNILGFNDGHIKKCGYYLKVKSLKGVNP